VVGVVLAVNRSGQEVNCSSVVINGVASASQQTAHLGSLHQRHCIPSIQPQRCYHDNNINTFILQSTNRQQYDNQNASCEWGRGASPAIFTDLCSSNFHHATHMVALRCAGVGGNPGQTNERKKHKHANKNVNTLHTCTLDKAVSSLYRPQYTPVV